MLYQQLGTIKERMSDQDIGAELFKSFDINSGGSSPVPPVSLVSGSVPTMNSDVGPEGVREEGASVSPQVSVPHFNTTLPQWSSMLRDSDVIAAPLSLAAAAAACWLSLAALRMLRLFAALLLLLQYFLLARKMQADTLTNDINRFQKQLT